MSVDDYFYGPESNKPRELIFGVVCEPPAPFPYHQGVVTRLASALHTHVTQEQIGDVYVSPIDVVLDAVRGLVLQPDILFVAAGNRAIVRDRIWGAPDLVVEVLSGSTASRDRTTKLAWYCEYGVRECWLVDPAQGTIDVIDCGEGGGRRTFAGDEPLISRVLPRLCLTPDAIVSR